MRRHVWDVAYDDRREQEVRAALEECGGNITHAAKRIKISRQQAHNAMVKYNLGDFAAELRAKRGVKRIGRPKKIQG